MLYAAAYVFLDRAYVLLDRDGARFLVHLRGKQALDEATLRAMAGEFENELLAQALRHRVVQANQRIIEDDHHAWPSPAPPAAAEPARRRGGATPSLIDMQDPATTASSTTRWASPRPWEAEEEGRARGCRR